MYKYNKNTALYSEKSGFFGYLLFKKLLKTLNLKPKKNIFFRSLYLIFLFNRHVHSEVKTILILHNILILPSL